MGKRLCREHQQQESARRSLRRKRSTKAYQVDANFCGERKLDEDRKKRFIELSREAQKQAESVWSEEKGKGGGIVLKGKSIQIVKYGKKDTEKKEYWSLLSTTMNFFLFVVQLCDEILYRSIIDSMITSKKDFLPIELWLNNMPYHSEVEKHRDVLPEMSEGMKGISFVFCTQGGSCDTILIDPETEMTRLQKSINPETDNDKVFKTFTLKEGQSLLFDGVNIFHKTSKVKSQDRQVIAMTFFL